MRNISRAFAGAFQWAYRGSLAMERNEITVVNLSDANITEHNGPLLIVESRQVRAIGD